jgi:TRAP-type C4-dicarboxylate transport system substrate-binding protein
VPFLMFSGVLFLLLSGSMQAAASTHPGQVIELNEAAPPNSPEDYALQSFKKSVYSATQGRLSIRVHLSGGLGNPQTSVQDMMFGDLSMFSGNLTDFLPLMIDEVSGLATPFLISGIGPTNRYVASPLLDEAREKVLHNRHIRFLEMTALRQPSHVIASKRALNSPADLVGLKFVSDKPLTKTAARLWETLGATYIGSSDLEMKSALESGRADAVIVANLDVIADNKLQAIAEHLVGVEDAPQIWQISINEGVWQRLDPNEREAVHVAAQNGARVYEKAAEHHFRSLLATMTSTGRITYHDLDPIAARQKLGSDYELLTIEGGLSPRVLAEANAAVSPSN